MPEVKPSERRRQWMDDGGQLPYRCLPLIIANQFGWSVLLDQTIEASWNGDEKSTGVVIRSRDNDKARVQATSHFGNGIVTFTFPFLVRTEPGFDLMITGPFNYPKPGAYALTGIAELDWAPVSFTMNWKLTDVSRPVVFSEGEPICNLAPVSRTDIEDFCPSLEQLEDYHDSEYVSAFYKWADSRNAYNRNITVKRLDKFKAQGDYTRGDVQGRKSAEHRTGLKLKSLG